MRKKIVIGLIAFGLLIAFAACNSPASTPLVTTPTSTLTPTIAPTLTATPEPTPTPAVVSIAVSGGNGSVKVGGTQRLTATAMLSDSSTVDVTGNVTWSSSGYAAAVSSSGLVTGVGAGTAQITATLDGLTGTFGITVMPTPSPTPTPTPQALLKILNWSWHTEYSYAIAEGEVQNLSGARLEDVTAVVSYYTEDGQFITSDYALIDYNPIMPGQTSPFKVYTTENPLMYKATLGFKYLLDGIIPATK